MRPDSLPPWLADFNAGIDPTHYEAELRACCAADSWVADLQTGRPYASVGALFGTSDAATVRLDGPGLDQALAAHPRIGERPTGVADSTAAWSRKEQAGMNLAGDVLREQVAAANADYERRFGHVYLVCATGLSAQQLLERCRSRLGNDDATEREVVLSELAKIARVRLGRLLHPDENDATAATATGGTAT